MKDENNVLAVDIGATKTNLGIFAIDQSSYAPIQEISVITKDFTNATELLQYFLGKCSHDIKLACIGVPGPVIDNQSITTNLPWVINKVELEQSLSIKKIIMVNDLEATAASVPLLKGNDLYELNKGLPRKNASMAVVSPGTGLGEAFLCKNGDGYTSYPSEGGHCDFAPSNSLEGELLAHLQDRIGHVSYEQVCSGWGIVNIYDFLKKLANEHEPEWLAELFNNADDPSKVIIDIAVGKEKSCPICQQALEIFVEILGAEAGNMGLKVMAFGGVYLGGGILPRIIDILDSKIFLKAFLNKGRMSTMLNDVPVHVIMNLKASLIGAASIAISSS